LLRIELERAAAGGAVEGVVAVDELRRNIVPVVQRRLQRGRDVVGLDRVLEVARHHDQRAVAGSVLEGGEFHVGVMVLYARILTVCARLRTLYICSVRSKVAISLN